MAGNSQKSAGASWSLALVIIRFISSLRADPAGPGRDPLALILRSHGGWIYYQARRYDEAIASYQKTLELDPDRVQAEDGLGLAYEQKGMLEDAVTHLCKPVPTFGPSVYLAHAYAISGRSREAIKILDYWKEKSKRGYVDQYLIALVYVGLGEKKQAFESLQRA